MNSQDVDERASEFPPTASHPDQVESLVEALSSVVDGHSAIYVSSPLTSGWRAVDHVRGRNSPGSGKTGREREEFRRSVVEPNRREAAKYVRGLRTKTSRVVIDPTAVRDLPGWAQSDYRVWWAEVIQRYVEAVVFRDGWHYSSGCVYEFLVACRAGIRTLREDLTPLAFEDGRDLISAAIRETEQLGTASEFLRHVYDALVPSEPAVEL